MDNQHHCRIGRRIQRGASAATAADLATIARIEAIIHGHGTLAEARTAAGLSVGQAARVLGWHRERILALESGVATATEVERSALCEAYAVDGWRDAAGVP